jgi:DNA-binding Xre family transcriptional regulator
MVVKYTNIFHSKAIKKLTKIEIFGLKINHLAALYQTDKFPRIFMGA